jgi:hypothetical protein
MRHAIEENKAGSGLELPVAGLIFKHRIMDLTSIFVNNPKSFQTNETRINPPVLDPYADSAVFKRPGFSPGYNKKGNGPFNL